MILITVALVALCLGAAVGVNHFVRIRHEKSRQPAAKAMPAVEADFLPDGTVRRAAITRLQVPLDELPADRAPFSRSTPAAVSLTPLAADAPEVREGLAFMQSWQKRADWRERLPLTLRHDRSEEMMQFFYEQRRGADPDFDLVAASPAMLVAGSERILLLHLPSRDRADGLARAYLHRTAGGKLRLDWDSFVGLSDMAWGEVRARRPTSPVLLRGFVTLDDYHNYEFADARRYLSLKVRSPEGDVALSAFCLRESALGRFFQSVLKDVPDRRSRELPAADRPLENMPAVLAIRFPRGAQSDHCVELLEAVAGRWMLFDGENALTARQTMRVSEEIITNLRESVLGTDRAAP